MSGWRPTAPPPLPSETDIPAATGGFPPAAVPRFFRPVATALARVCILGVALLSSCLPTVPKDGYDRGGLTLHPGPVPEAPGTRAGALTASAAMTDSASGAAVELHYLGVGGWRIATPRTVVLTGPLLTRVGMFSVGLGARLRPDSAVIRSALDAWQVGPLDRTTAILVGHGHYDHLLDTPWFAARLAPRARILTNGTSRLQLLPLLDSLGVDPERVEDVGGAAATPERPGAWIRLGPDVRVMPVVGDHAPHFAGHTLYNGVRERELPGPPGPADEWLDGESLAFLIDVLRPDGSVALRLYYQDAIPREPGGMLPPALTGDGVPVDLALLVPASFAEVKWHPEALVENLAPRAVLVQHWEDFFAPALEPAEPVAFTILPDFLARARRAMGCEGCVRVPVPGTRYVVPLGSAR